MDVTQTLLDVSPLAVAATVGVMLGCETLSPLVALPPAPRRLRHGLVNVGLALSTSAVAIGGTSLLITAAQWANAHQVGLCNLWPLSWPWQLVAALVGIDFFEWLRHRAHHRIPLLWRLHRVHHTDTHVDATTSIRGHPFESVLAYVYFSTVVLLLGLHPLALALRTLVAVVALAWHHSALHIPLSLDVALSWVTPTPRTHRLHHAREVRFTDSNYGTLFTWWDRLAGTFTPGTTSLPTATGLDGFDEPQAQTLWGVLRSPFF